MKKIAIPTEEGKLTGHFGQAAQMYFCTLDEENNVVKEETLPTPPHAPGVIPKFVHDNQASHIIVSGLGAKAHTLFDNFGIKVVKGAPLIENQLLVKQLVADALFLDPKECNHDHKHDHDCDKH